MLSLATAPAGAAAPFVPGSPVAPDGCSGCSDLVSSNFDATGLLVVLGPLGSAMEVRVTHRAPGICNPDCSVEGLCEFELAYSIEFGPHGVAWERTDSVRSAGGETWADQGVERISPHAGWEVDDSVGRIDVSCGFQWLYWSELWFDQDVAPGAPAPNLWQVGPVSVRCTPCTASN